MGRRGYHARVPALLEVQDLAVRYGAAHEPAVRALEDVSLDVEPGEAVGLLGESGCGKSTLLLAVLGLLPPTGRVVRGSIRFRGRPLVGAGEREMRAIRGAEIALVFQDASLALNPVRRVGTQVAEVLAAHRPWTRRQCREAAVASLAEVGFEEPGRVFEAYAHELSGGQRQRVVLARALACRPALLLADEPTSSLDAATRAEWRVLLASLQRRLGLAVLLVSHDLASIAAVAGRALVMYAGRVVEAGTSAQVFGSPLHPYTRGLLRAFPGALAAAHRAPLVGIPGAPPDPARLPAGCAFEPRCAERLPACAGRPPGPVSPAESRQVRCFSYGG
jgi:oligopeptide/dipeptide ABC transporter ATP-binding protein